MLCLKATFILKPPRGGEGLVPAQKADGSQGWWQIAADIQKEKFSVSTGEAMRRAGGWHGRTWSLNVTAVISVDPPVWKEVCGHLGFLYALVLTLALISLSLVFLFILEDKRLVFCYFRSFFCFQLFFFLLIFHISQLRPCPSYPEMLFSFYL